MEIGKYRPKSFIKWCAELDRDVWWDLFEPSFANTDGDDLLKKEYEKYLINYLRDKKLKDLL